MKRTLVALALATSAAFVPTSADASDHIDGVKTALDNAADVTDLYTFTSPEDANKLVLIMNVHGVAFSRSRFSNAVDYKFRIRPIENVQTLTPSSDARKEQSIVCTFSGGSLLLDARQRATCTYSFGSGSETVAFDTRSTSYRAGGAGRSASTRVFAGVRSDSWFLDLGKTLKYNAGLPVMSGPGVNGLWGMNVLSIVVEIDKSKLPSTLVAVTAQTVRK